MSNPGFGPWRPLLALALAVAASGASAQSLTDLRNDAATPGDVTTYGMGWGQQRHSTLKQITPSQRQAPGAGVECEPGQLGQCLEPATADRRRDVRGLALRTRWPWTP